MQYGRIDFSRIDTTPGGVSAFSPPEGFAGNYRQFMRDRWKNDSGVRQHVAVVGRLLGTGSVAVTFTGSYADEARQIALSSK
ncbi:MAG: hypothetical protein Q8M09_14905 [Pseudomonadota bacterium]|nr:hypothetical protein [Pseudomonadota bacterium]MDP1905513.1 hypothetical protein [Pseudomonadota bacterium]